MDGVTAFRTFSQILCPEDAAFWCKENMWSHRPTEEELKHVIEA